MNRKDRMHRGRNGVRAQARKGMTLVEIGLGIGLVGLVSVGMMQVVGEQTQAQRATSAATSMALVEGGAEQYMRANYQTLLTATPVAGVPIQVRAGRTTAAGVPPAGSLQAGGFLPPGFIDRDGYRLHHVLLVRQPSLGVLEGLLVQVGDSEIGLGADPGATIRDVELGRIVTRLRNSGGARFTNNPIPANATVVQGNSGGWSTDVATWAPSGITPRAGRAAATLSYGNASLLSDYLNRYNIGIPDANRMHTALDMSNNDVNAAKTVNANYVNMQNGGMACAANVAGCKFWISADGGFADMNTGTIEYQGSTVGGGLRITGAGNNLTVDGNTALSQDLTVGTNSYLNGNVNVGGATALGSSLSVAGNQNNAGTLTVLGATYLADATVNGTLKVTGLATFGSDVNVAGSVYGANEVIAGNDLVALNGNVFANRSVVSLTGDVIANQNVTALNGAVFANTDLVARTGNVFGNQSVVALNGDVIGAGSVVARNGDINAINGNIYSNNGSVLAQQNVQAFGNVTGANVLSNGSVIAQNGNILVQNGGIYSNQNIQTAGDLYSRGVLLQDIIRLCMSNGGAC